MYKRILLLGLLFCTSHNLYAAERYLLRFEITQGVQKVDSGKTYITKKKDTWSRGLRSSYLVLSCHHKDDRMMEKRFSTVDHFDGLRISHQLDGDQVILEVVRNKVKPRLTEIRALPRNSCKDLAPIVTSHKANYRLAANDGITEIHPFGEGMSIKFSLQGIGDSR